MCLFAHKKGIAIPSDLIEQLLTNEDFNVL